MPPSLGDTLCPSVPGQDAGSSKDIDQCLGALVIALDEIADPPPETPGARSPAGFGTDDPAQQLAPLLSGEANGECAVGGLQQVMAFVEDIAGRNSRIIEPAESGLRHHQGVVGDNNLRLPCLANVLFDKAAPKMRTGRVHALAAAIGQPADPTAPNELGEPAGKVAGHQITRLGRSDPAGYQSEMAGGSCRAAHWRADRVLIV